MSQAAPHARAPQAPPLDSIPARFARVAAQHAERTAIAARERDWSYAELAQRARAIADGLREFGCASGEPIALLCAHDAPLIAALLGVLEAGALYLALDPADAPERWSAMLLDSGARFVLADAAHAPQLEPLLRAQGAAAARLVPLEALLERDAPRAPAAAPAGEAAAWLVYTSGSSGAPRGVWQSHANVVHHSEVYAELARIGPDDRLSLLTSCSLSASVTQIFAALLHGAALCPYHVRTRGLEPLADWLRAQRVTIYHSVPTVFRHALRARAARAELEALRLVRLGGEAVLRSDLELARRHARADCTFVHSYSSTETCLISALVLEAGAEPGPGPLSVGRPVRGVELELLDEQLEPVAPGAEGRIAVQSAQLARGYWRAPEASAAAFANVPGDARLRRFLSQDLGRRRADGALEHLGRADSLVKLRGQRVSLAQLESALGALEGVAEAASATAQDAQGTTRLVAYLVPRPGRALDARSCRIELQSKLPPSLLPDRVVLLPRLPLNAAGKLDRRQLPALAEARERAPAARARPREELEQRLAGLWKAILGLESVGREDDFFELGGTSLHSLELLARIEDIFGLCLPPASLIEHNTIERLAARVAAGVLSPARGAVVPLRAADDAAAGAPTGAAAARPLFLVHEGKGNVAVYGQLARQLGQRPCYALQAAGLNGERWPALSLPAMARAYAREITAVDPQGPYLLAGSCIGGLIAFEVAQQLERAGRRVALLALMDTECPAPGSTRPRWKECTIDELRDWARIARWGVLRGFGLGRSPRWLPAYRRFVNKMIGRARRRYRPRVFAGRLSLLLSRHAHYAGRDPRLAMAAFARESELVWLDVKPAELLLPPHVRALGAQLEACIERALPATVDAAAGSRR